MRYLACAFGTLWALPTTLLGLALAIAGGARPYALRPGLCWHWVPWAGFWEWWYRPESPWGAVTFGSLTIINDVDANEVTVIRHERQHTKQAWLLGPFFLPVYLCMWCIELARDKGDDAKAYRDIPLEVAAYAREGRPDAWG